MNPGYLSYIAMTLSVILLIFGWRNTAIGNGMISSALLFIVGWTLSISVEWEGWWNGSGTLVYLPMLSLVAGVWICSQQRRYVFSALCFALLVGAVICLVQLIEAVDPRVILTHVLFDPLLVAIVLILCYTRVASVQFAMITVALLVNDVYMALLYRGLQPSYFGGRILQDAWWMTAFAVRTSSASLDRMGVIWREQLSRLRG